MTLIQILDNKIKKVKTQAERESSMYGMFSQRAVRKREDLELLESIKKEHDGQ